MSAQSSGRLMKQRTIKIQSDHSVFYFWRVKTKVKNGKRRLEHAQSRSKNRLEERCLVLCRHLHRIWGARFNWKHESKKDRRITPRDGLSTSTIERRPNWIKWYWFERNHTDFIGINFHSSLIDLALHRWSQDDFLHCKTSCWSPWWKG